MDFYSQKHGWFNLTQITKEFEYSDVKCPIHGDNNGSELV